MLRTSRDFHLRVVRQPHPLANTAQSTLQRCAPRCGERRDVADGGHRCLCHGGVAAGANSFDQHRDPIIHHRPSSRNYTRSKHVENATQGLIGLLGHVTRCLHPSREVHQGLCSLGELLLQSLLQRQPSQLGNRAQPTPHSFRIGRGAVHDLKDRQDSTNLPQGPHGFVRYFAGQPQAASHQHVQRSQRTKLLCHSSIAIHKCGDQLHAGYNQR
mmetsp:Transcript_67258/g.193394  ORF Transcript_67258/g.193394 Transcript_67258/m.193394 type:complete len:214 (+) Transcript_67258:1076-1717(+)